MKHATLRVLEQISSLLSDLRAIPGLKEKKAGIFCVGSRAFLHFHEDGDDIFADVRLTGPHFDRIRVSTVAERRALLSKIAAHLRTQR